MIDRREIHRKNRYGNPYFASLQNDGIRGRSRLVAQPFLIACVVKREAHRVKPVLQERLR
jgi:hypothetical protein